MAIVLALTASLAWGASQFLAGVQGRRVPLLALLVASQGAGLLLSGVVVVARGDGPPALEPVAWALGSGVASALTVAVFYRALSVGVLGIVAPITGTAGVVPVVFGLLTGERLTGVEGLGVALAVAGVVLASVESRAASGRRVGAGVGLALVAALGIGGFLVLTSVGSRGDPYWTILLGRATSVCLLAAAASVIRPAVSLGRADAAGLVAVGVLDTGGVILFAVASTLGSLSTIAVLASLYPVVTVVLARAVLHERVRAPQRTGTVAALAGAALIAAG